MNDLPITNAVAKTINGKRNPAYQAILHHRMRVKQGFILPRETKANLRPYKEPLEAVKDGYGFLGTVAQNETGTHMQCHICGYFYGNVGRHAKAIHGVDQKEYKQRFQLSLRRGLVSDTVRTMLINNNLRQPRHVKEERVRRMKILQRTYANHEMSQPKKSLEAKNKEGRCYYQLLDKIELLGKKLKRTPTRRDFSKEYGEGYLGSLYGTFGTWNQALSFAGFTPNRQKEGQPKYSRESVIAMFRNFYEIEGRVPRSSDIGTMIPSNNVIRRLFGGMIEARQAAGFGQNDYVNETVDIR